MNGQVSLTSDVHNTQFVQTFGDLFRNKILTDVTLLCEDKFKIEAHKVVLCAGSNFFREFFSNNAKDHLILYMRGIQKNQIMPLVQFLYCGETTVPDGQVKEILDIAKELEISSLDEEKFTRDIIPSYEKKIDQNKEQKNEQIIDLEFSVLSELACQYCKFVGFNKESFEKHKKFAHKENVTGTVDISPSQDLQVRESLLELSVDEDIGQDDEKYFEANLVLRTKTRSPYWNFFKFAGTDLKGPSKILHCMLCLDSNDVKMRKKDLPWSSGTSAIKNHMVRFHEDIVIGLGTAIDENNK